MDRKKLLLLAAALALPFLFYILFKQNFLGMDSYNFLSFICNGTPLKDQPWLAEQIFGLIPCDFVLIKLFQYSLALVSLIAIAKTGEIYHKNGWLAGILALGTPIFVFEAFRLENDQLAYPILFIANYFMLSGVKRDSHIQKIAGIALIGLAGLLWEGAVFYLLPIAFLTLWAAPFALGAIALFHRKIMAHVLPNTTAFENVQGLGLLYLGTFLFTILGVFMEYSIAIPAVYWLILLSLNAKFSIHAIPFLAVGGMFLYNHPALNNLDKRYGKPIWKTVKLTLIISSIMLAGIIGITSAVAQPPTAEHTALVQEFVELQQAGADAKNDWSYGYWIKFYGGEPSAWGGGLWQQDYNSGTILTYRDLNCSILGEAREMKLFQC